MTTSHYELDHSTTNAMACNPEMYHETVAVPLLSPTYQSNQILTPQQTPQRRTVSESRYNQFYEKFGRAIKPDWGRQFSYAGIGPVNLPPGLKSKEGPPTRVEKGHMHYGSGIIPFPTTPIQQDYYRTGSQLSRLRKTDELVPKPLTADLVNRQIKQPFPREHPYASHISRLSIFPSPVSPDELNSRVAAEFASYDNYPSPVPTGIASQPAEQVVCSKTKGSPWRHEIVQDAEHPFHKKSLTWHGESVYELFKGPHERREQIYPTPPKTVVPNFRPRTNDLSISLETADAVADVRRSLMTTRYQTEYGSHVPNVLKIHRKGEVTSETAARMRKKRGRVFIGNFFSEVYLSDTEDEDDDDGVESNADLVADASEGEPVQKYRESSVKAAQDSKMAGILLFPKPKDVTNGISGQVITSGGELQKTSPRVTVSEKVMVSDGIHPPVETTLNTKLEDNVRKAATYKRHNTPYIGGECAILSLQSSYSKSSIHKKFNGLYPELSPDLRRNLRTGKRQKALSDSSYAKH